MPRTGTYYVGRVLKQGFKQEDLVRIVMNSPVIDAGEYSWTISDPEEYPEYVFAKLTKFQAKGSVVVVDTGSHRSVEQPQPHLIRAESPFVYLPDYSGIAFLHVWNNIEYSTFQRRFSELVREAYRGFFAECSVELISDLRSFVARAERLGEINRVYAKVEPPNPLFGRYWKSLEEYLRRRNVEELTVDEKSNSAIVNSIVDVLRRIVEREDAGEHDNEVDIADAAILMATDGYGKGKLEGRIEGREITLKTDDTRVSFKMPTDPSPQSLHDQARRILARISDDRYMEER